MSIPRRALNDVNKCRGVECTQWRALTARAVCKCRGKLRNYQEPPVDEIKVFIKIENHWTRTNEAYEVLFQYARDVGAEKAARRNIRQFSKAINRIMYAHLRGVMTIKYRDMLICQNVWS